MKRIAIFASGTGTNAANIIRYFDDNHNIHVKAILSNNPSAGVLNVAKEAGVDSLVFTREEFYETDKVIRYLLDNQIDLVVLAGFLWLVPELFIHSFPKKIINIHPALLPAFGGKGMYGARVHQAVKAANKQETGITIHYVNPHYDEGDIIFQTSCSLSDNDTPDTIAAKVHKLEYEFYPKVIEQLLN